MHTMEELRDALVRIQVEHEKRCPGHGLPCRDSRANRIGYLAHVLGIRGPEQWRDVMKYAQGYDGNCVGRDCLHESN